MALILSKPLLRPGKIDPHTLEDPSTEKAHLMYCSEIVVLENRNAISICIFHFNFRN